jgi:hypothetical protein
MKKKVKLFLKVLLSIFLIWILLLITINLRSIIELTKFAFGYMNYAYLSNDLVPKGSDYKILYDLVNLDQDLSIIPKKYFVNEPTDNNLSLVSKINYYRMLYILKCLDSSNIKYDTIPVPDGVNKSSLHTYDIFIKNSDKSSFNLITAHYDILKRPGYQGAQDNSASVAILLNVIKKCKPELKNKNIAFLFTAMEEQSCMGAEKFMNYSRYHAYSINSVICLDGVGRGSLAVMRNSMGRLGLIYRNWYLKKKVFNGSESKDCPEYSKISRSVVDFDKYNIKVLSKFLSSTDARVFSRYKIPTVHLTSGDIPHFIKVMHQNKDKIDGLHYKSLLYCQDILTDIVKNIK